MCTLFKVFRYTGGVQSTVNSDCQVYLSEMLTCLLWVRLSGVWCCLSGAVEVSYRSSNMYNLIITLSRILANLADSQTQVKPMHIITLVLIIVTTNKLTIFEAESSATRNSLTATESFRACHGCTVTTGIGQCGWGNSWHM